ncbi:MAG TPA: NfeD family protein [Bacillota bacterium]|nr:NfeD family protein [Bacillota bacterium]
MRKFLLWMTIVLLVALSVPVAAAQETILRVEIHGEVDPVMARHVERAVARALEIGAKAILFDINTPGGRIDAATDISAAILQSPVKTVAVVTGQAWSAGALIALSANDLYMLPGTSIGAAEPIPRTEKIVSAWRGAMESAAEQNGRDARLAGAMVDSDVEIEGVIERGKLLSLTAFRAVELGMADGSADNVQEALAQAELAPYTLEDVPYTTTENTLRFVTNSQISTLLLIIGLVGVVVEVISPGFGLPGIIGMVAFGFYFAGNIMSGQASQVVLMVFGLGVVLLAAEAFIAGFGIAGISGILLVIASLVLAAGDTALGLKMVTFAAIVSAALIAVLWRFLAKRNILAKLSLQARSTSEEGYLAGVRDVSLVGKTGTTITHLRPSGLADIEGRRYDVITEGAYVPAGATVVVMQAQGGRIVVKPLTE